MRISPNSYFLRIVRDIAMWSTCVRKDRQIGAVIVGSNKHILSTGFNGAPRGMKHCLDIGCLRDKLGIKSGEHQQTCRGVHAEQNAVIQAAEHGVSMAGTTMYTTFNPCVICAKMLINVGILHVVYERLYPDLLGGKMLAEAGVQSTQIDLDSDETHTEEPSQERDEYWSGLGDDLRHLEIQGHWPDNITPRWAVKLAAKYLCDETGSMVVKEGWRRYAEWLESRAKGNQDVQNCPHGGRDQRCAE